MLRLIAIFCLVLSAFVSKAQLDTIHYFPPLYSSEGDAGQYVYLSTPSFLTIEVEMLSSDGNLIQTFQVSNINPIEHRLGGDRNTRTMVRRDQLNFLQNNEGLIFKSNSEFYCNIRFLSNDGAQSGSATCKGTVARGRRFRPGHMLTYNSTAPKSNNISIMAVEDCDITLSNLPTDLDIINLGTTSGTINYSLVAGQTLILAADYDVFNPNAERGFYGSLLESTGDIVVNCASLTGGTNRAGWRDYGMDQIVSMADLGTEYIAIRGNGLDEMEAIVVVIDQDSTDLSVNGTALGQFDAGEHVILDEIYYSANDNMYVTSSRPIVLYQTMGGEAFEATFGMNFVPPTNCLGKNLVDNIPFYNNIETFTYTGNVVIIARSGNAVLINGTPINQNLGLAITGSSEYVTYKLPTTTSFQHLTVRSNANIQVGLFGANYLIGFCGYFSGFAKFPEAIITDIDIINGFCLDSLSATGNYENIDWYFNGVLFASDTDDVATMGPGTYFALGFYDQCPEIQDTTFIYVLPEPDTLFIDSLTCFPQDTGVFVRYEATQKGCDSIIVERLGLIPIDTMFFDSLTCFPQDTGVFIRRETTLKGCDSIIIETIGLLPNNEMFIDYPVCSLDSIGLDTVYLSNRFGCDSTIYINYYPLRRDTSFRELYVCSASDVRLDTLRYQNGVGCDSTEYLSYLYAGYDTIVSMGEICEGDIFNFEGQEYSQAGMYCHTYSTLLDCDSTLCLNLDLRLRFAASLSDTICQNESVSFEGETYSTSGEYSVVYPSAIYCDSSITLNLTVLPPLSVNITGPDSVLLGGSISLSYQTSRLLDNFGWYSTEVDSCNLCSYYEWYPEYSQTVDFWGIDSKGCRARDAWSFTVYNPRNVYIPNTFSPNNDGLNDFFVVFGDRGVKGVLDYKIFDRWGANIYHAQDLKHNVNSGFWDGYYHGKLLNPGVFVYLVEVEYLDGTKGEFSGDVTLMH